MRRNDAFDNSIIAISYAFSRTIYFKQDGDGYVLVTETTDGILKNTPISSILKWFEKTGELIDEDILYKLSI